MLDLIDADTALNITFSALESTLSVAMFLKYRSNFVFE